MNTIAAIMLAFPMIAHPLSSRDDFTKNKTQALLKSANEEKSRLCNEVKSAKDAFQQRLKQVRSEKKRRQDSDKDLMNRANIPYYYRDRCKVKREPDGTVNFYFGGIGDSDGYGHAHVSMDSSGNITYNRDVFDTHGAKNFSDYQERQKEYEMKKQQHQRQGWDSEIVHGVLDKTDELVAVKYKYRDGNVSDILIARDTQDSDLEDITKENEEEHPHVHAWNQDKGIPDHHDMRSGSAKICRQLAIQYTIKMNCVLLCSWRMDFCCQLHRMLLVNTWCCIS